ncbi:UNVERIFIED_CONTAM: hypothetical protein FKN15_023266 [Acipenser sinensis]
MKAAVLIQRWYRQYVARMEVRRRCTWTIFQSIEYAGEQDQIKLQNFFTYLMDHFTPTNSNQRDLISHIFTEDEVYQETELEKYFDHESIELPEPYTGPHIDFPLTAAHAAALVEAFRHKQNGLPSVEKPYIFNGDYVDRGKNSIEILLILFAFLLVYPNEVHMNRGNHEDYIVNLRYGFTKEVMQKYKYVSVLRPPKKKKRHNMSEALSIRGGRTSEGDIQTTNMDSRPSLRRLSLTSTPCYSPGTRKRSPHDISRKVRRSVEEELEKCRRQVGFSEPYEDGKFSLSFSESDSESFEVCESDNAEWKQIVDILWSDPMHQEGCVPNAVRGGGCYYGPDVTEKVLSRHNIQLLIRSHECKQDGYEFCHNRKAVSDYDITTWRNRYGRVSLEGRKITDEDEVWTGARKWLVRLNVDPLGTGGVRHIPNSIVLGPNRGLIVDILWSDPMHQEGCVPNAVRGGGCYYGPDVTEKVLSRHNIQLLIRSHECKQDGYEFCHNRKVLTIFSASNYYELGSNRGAYVKLGPDLIPHLVQYQVSRTTRKLTMKQRVSRVERSALRALREQLFSHKSDLISAFEKYDKNKTGLVSFEEFCQTWKLLSSHLNMEISNEAISDLARSIDFNKDGSIDINEFLEAFRLVDKIHYTEREGSLLLTTPGALL